MAELKNHIRKYSRYIIPFLILYWIIWLPGNNEYFNAFKSTNFIMGIFSLIAFYFDKRSNSSITRRQHIIISLFSFLFATMSILGGITSSAPSFILIIPLAFIGAFFAAYSIMHLLLTCKLSVLNKEHFLKFKPITVFLFCFFVTAFIYLAIFFTAFYPGILTPDSINQANQNVNHIFSNHHPYYHTIILGFFQNIGISIFKDINLGIAFFNIFQIFVMSAIFSFVIMTLYQRKVPLWIIVSAFLWYSIHPINILYSFTVWKDVLFGGAALLFITAVARVFLNIGKNHFNYALTLFSGLAFCLWRSNGFYAFILTTLFFLIIFFKKYKLLSLGLLCISIFSYILTGPVLSLLNVSKPDTIENLSIPAQQIARVVTDGGKLTEQEYTLLSKVIDVEKIPSLYESYISDPIKIAVREKGGNKVISENKEEFIKLWIHLGIRNPKQYILAWADQTKGYFYGGHNYWQYATNISKNNLNIEQTVNVPTFRNIFLSYYAKIFSDPNIMPILNIFVSIGLMFWVVMAAFTILIAKKEIKRAFVLFPIISIILSLFIATPVYSEFRYAYSLFISLPIIGLLLNNIHSSKEQVE